ncbi:unnamed protein product [Durusdinium trenchii]|uniref:PARP catalytic domain-containing protein n=1 Tax=Durusdinium trenchii TaxID=1381693 RepID=A0ABP0HEF3_9DINO
MMPCPGDGWVDKTSLACSWKSHGNVHNAPQAPPANQCAAGCGRPSFNGQAGQFCGLTCRQKFAKPTPTVRASQPSKRGPDVLAMGGKGQTFEAWHGTSRTNALQIKSSGCFRVDTPADGCLGKGAYFAGRRKAERFAHDFGQGQPALVRCSITVQNPCYVDGDDRSWQARYLEILESRMVHCFQLVHPSRGGRGSERTGTPSELSRSKDPA